MKESMQQFRKQFLCLVTIYIIALSAILPFTGLNFRKRFREAGFRLKLRWIRSDIRSALLASGQSDLNTTFEAKLKVTDELMLEVCGKNESNPKIKIDQEFSGKKLLRNVFELLVLTRARLVPKETAAKLSSKLRQLHVAVETSPVAAMNQSSYYAWRNKRDLGQAWRKSITAYKKRCVCPNDNSTRYG